MAPRGDSRAVEGSEGMLRYGTSASRVNSRSIQKVWIQYDFDFILRQVFSRRFRLKYVSAFPLYQQASFPQSHLNLNLPSRMILSHIYHAAEGGMLAPRFSNMSTKDKDKNKRMSGNKTPSLMLCCAVLCLIVPYSLVFFLGPGSRKMHKGCMRGKFGHSFPLFPVTNGM